MTDPNLVLDTIAQLTDELSSAFEEQASTVTAEIETMSLMVGDFQEWHMGPTLIFRRTAVLDHEPNAWERFYYDWRVEAQPHSRQGEAQGALNDAQDEYNTTDTNQMSDQEKLAAIPTRMGGFLSHWYEVDTDFSRTHYAADASEIESSGNLEGWLSSQASSVYHGAIGTQHGAATASATILESFMTNSAAFLDDVTSAISQMMIRASEDEQLYIDLISAGAELADPSIGAFINYFVGSLQVLKDQRDLYFGRLADHGTSLNNAISTTLQVGVLSNNINDLGADDQWPDVTSNLRIDEPSPEVPTTTELRYNTQYFKDHVAHWDDIADDMGALHAKAADFPELSVDFIELPNFSAIQSTHLNDLGHRLADDVFAPGHAAALEMSQKLTETIRTYLENEMDSAGAADALFSEYFGD